MMRLSVPIYQLKRRAKTMAREQGIPLHKAQNLVAEREGFSSWGLLASKGSWRLPNDVLSGLAEGDCVLLSARPGHGKTLLGLKLLLDGSLEGRRAVLFTFEYVLEEARNRLRALAHDGSAELVEIETADDIDANYIIDVLSRSPMKTIAVIDYLQLLDQRRSKPAIYEQLQALRSFAKDRGIILVFISQVDRSFEPTRDKLPGINHIRAANLIPLEVFTKGLFLHAGHAKLQDLTADQ